LACQDPLTDGGGLRWFPRSRQRSRCESEGLPLVCRAASAPISQAPRLSILRLHCMAVLALRYHCIKAVPWVGSEVLRVKTLPSKVSCRRNNYLACWRRRREAAENMDCPTPCHADHMQAATLVCIMPFAGISHEFGTMTVVLNV